MILRPALLGLMLLAGAASPASATETLNGRVDLFLLSALKSRALVAARVGFDDGAASCPQDNGTLSMSRGLLTLHRLTSPENAQRVSLEPAADDAYVLRLATQECQWEIAIQLRTQHDGALSALLLPKIQRPSVPEKERAELQDQLMKRLRERIREQQVSPATASDADVKAALDERFAAEVLLDGVTAKDDIAEFEGAPAGCVEMLGSYAVDRHGITFSFLANLPGDFNRFLMERVDLDNTSSRVQLTRHGCRLDFTVTKLVKQNGLWLAVAREGRREAEAERPK